MSLLPWSCRSGERLRITVAGVILSDRANRWLMVMPLK